MRNMGMSILMHMPMGAPRFEPKFHSADFLFPIDKRRVWYQLKVIRASLTLTGYSGQNMIDRR